jgi:primosomal protein N' (replication factor Y) (superfamily II helicase)
MIMHLIAEVLLPVAIYKPYSYLVPIELESEISVGMRVEVQFGKNRLYSGIVFSLTHKESVTDDKLKSIIGLLDAEPIVHEAQLKLWVWVASYYATSMGEVMAAALPGAFKPGSDSFLVINTKVVWTDYDLSDDEYLIAEALSIRERLPVSDIQAILQKKSVLKCTNSLVDKGIAFWEESLEVKYQVKYTELVGLKSPYNEPEHFTELLTLVQKSEKQTRAILYLIQHTQEQGFISKKNWFKACGIQSADGKKLQEKGLVEFVLTNDSRIYQGKMGNPDLLPLAPFQEKAYVELVEAFKQKPICLLHGVTGSGKTRIYQELIDKVIKEGGQVLYLLPEISLSTQMESRLHSTYGDQMLAYHSRVNPKKKVEIWQAVYNGHPLVLAARSGVFLPFKNLQLVIVDEEHDASFKQAEPSPYYNARDISIYLSHLTDARVLLGSATPSLETYYQAKNGRYGYVALHERFGGATLPEVNLIDLRAAQQSGKMVSVFSQELLQEIERTWLNKQKIILFQNRRGFAPVYQCGVCQWKAECKYCDISLTHHKHNNTLKCHYCNYTTPLPVECPKCGARSLELKGFGTEKIEDELHVFFPDMIVKRFDADSTSSGSNLTQILDAFASDEIDVLVGTQMVTKGLDFDNVGLVGVLAADAMMYYPDFRAMERTFQLLVQVAGRAGRRKTNGLVLLQTYQPDNLLLKEIAHMNLYSFYEREMEERRKYAYPPFTKLIKVTVRHKDPKQMHEAVGYMANELKKSFGNRIIGPAIPPVGRIKSYYQSQILIKLERDSAVLTLAKNQLWTIKEAILKMKGKSTTRIIVDVDPYYS